MKNTKTAKSLVSLALALAMVLCCLPAAFASENKVTVEFSFYNGSVVIPKMQITFYDGVAEEYGYNVSASDHNGVPINKTTVFDAIVAAHQAYYGDNFTAENADDYLSMTNGFITRIFGLSTSALGFCVNDKMPVDDVYIEAYGGYTGYACDTAVISDGDYISVFTYQDSMWSDYYITLSDTEITVSEGEEFTVSATGFSVMWYGYANEEAIANATKAMAGLDVKSTSDFENYSLLGALNENGEITLSFDEPGIYWLCIEGSYSDPDSGSVPVVANWCKVTVIEEKADEPQDSDETDEDAFYLPYGLSISFGFEEERNAFVIGFMIDMFDINGNAPDKTESFIIEISSKLFYGISDFLADIF